jgi:serine protease AprX
MAQGAAKMMMIATNPDNDGVDEIVNAFTVRSNNGVRASLAWIDDEGTEQDDTDGVDNTTSRMVYDFSMKLEQVAPALNAFPYNNLSIANPSAPTVAGNNWFQAKNNYLQANLTATTANAQGNVIIRKSTTSPAAVREMALIIADANAGVLNTTTATQKENILFYDKTSEKIRLISNANQMINNYEIFTVDGKLLTSGVANANEISFANRSKNIYIVKFTINNQVFSQKFSNF